MRRLSFFEAQGFGVPEFDSVCAEQALEKWSTIQAHTERKNQELREVKTRIRDHTHDRNALQRKIQTQDSVAVEDLEALDEHQRQIDSLQLTLAALEDHWKRHFELPRFKLTPMDRRVLYGQKAIERNRQEMINLNTTAPVRVPSPTKDTPTQPANSGVVSKRKPPHRLPSATTSHTASLMGQSEIKTPTEEVLGLNQEALQCLSRNDLKGAKGLLTDAMERLLSEANEYPGDDRGRLLSVTHNNMACLAKKSHRPQSALQHLEVVMSSNAQQSDEEDPTTLLNLCAVLCDIKRFGDGVLAARRAVIILQKALHEVLSASDPFLATSGGEQRDSRLELYVSALYNLGMCQLQLLQRYPDVSRQALNPSSTLQVSEGDFKSYVEGSEAQHALTTLRLALTMSRQLLGDDHSMTVKARTSYKGAVTLCSALAAPPPKDAGHRSRSTARSRSTTFETRSTLRNVKSSMS